MLLIWPRGIELRGAGAPPVLSWMLLALAIAAELISSLALHLPPTLVSLVAGARLSTDPAQATFAPWQLWTGCLIHGGWSGLLLSGLAFAILGGALERRLGSLLFALTLVALAPIGSAVPLLAGIPSPALGLGTLAAGCAGGLLALAPRATLRLELWWWAVVAVGRARRRIAVHWVLAGFIALEAWRLGSLPRTGLDALASEFLPLYAASLVLVVAAGHLLGRSLVGLHDQSVLAPLSRLAAGEGALAELPGVLDQIEAPPLVQLAAVGERAMREGDREAATLVLARLSLQAPESGTARRLRGWLAGVD